MQQLTEAVRRFREARDWDQYNSPKNLAMALMVEAAELAEIFQWLTQAESYAATESRRAEIADEIGDVLIYLVNLADKCGIDPLQAAHDKMVKNNAKYPADKFRGRRHKPGPPG